MTDRKKGLSDTDAPAFARTSAPSGTLRLKVTQIGNSLGVILPKELLAKLNVAKGDVLIATDADGGVNLTAYDAELADDLADGKDIMRRYRDTLKALAK
jgi:putative addiction module antidote